MVVVANGKFMCIELKRVKGGVVSTAQKEWIQSLKDVGISVAVCKGVDDAIKFIESA